MAEEKSAVVTIDHLETKAGETDGRDWVRTTAVGTDKRSYTTFDEARAAELKGTLNIIYTEREWKDREGRPHISRDIIRLEPVPIGVGVAPAIRVAPAGEEVTADDRWERKDQLSARQTSINAAANLVAATLQPGEPVRTADVLELAETLYGFVWEGKRLEPTLGAQGPAELPVSAPLITIIDKLMTELDMPDPYRANYLRKHFGREGVATLTLEQGRACRIDLYLRRFLDLIRLAPDTALLKPIEARLEKAQLPTLYHALIMREIDRRQGELIGRIQGDTTPVGDAPNA